MDSTMFDFMLERAHHWPVYAKKIIDSTKWSLVDSTVGDWAQEQIPKAYATGKMPQLLLT